MSGLLLIGGGGHCLSVIDALDRTAWDSIGVIDMPERIGETVLGVPVIGCDKGLASLRGAYESAFVSLGSVGDWRRRGEILRMLDMLGYHMITIAHPAAAISPDARIGRGVLVGAGAAVNALAEIGEACILNTGCIVEHQCTIGAFAHIAPGAVLCGGVTVGAGSHIGAGSVIREGIAIGKNVMIGAGSMVTRDVPNGVVAFGNPCREMGYYAIGGGVIYVNPPRINRYTLSLRRGVSVSNEADAS